MKIFSFCIDNRCIIIKLLQGTCIDSFFFFTIDNLVLSSVGVFLVIKLSFRLVKST
jgi:hypothetical protein